MEAESVNTEEERYKYLHKELRSETNKAREAWWDQQCEELETMDRMGRTDLMYTRIKNLAKKNRNGSSESTAKSAEGNVLLIERQ